MRHWILAGVWMVCCGWFYGYLLDSAIHLEWEIFVGASLLTVVSSAECIFHATKAAEETRNRPPTCIYGGDYREDQPWHKG